MISTLISVDWTHGLTSNEGDAPEGRAAPSKTKIKKTMDPIFTVCLSAPSLCVCLSVFLCLPLSSFVSLFVFISVSVSLFVTAPPHRLLERKSATVSPGSSAASRSPSGQS